MEHANQTINSKDNLRSAPSSPTQHSGKSVTTSPEERDQCETPSEDALRSVQGGGVCGGNNMCDPAILAEVFFPVLHNKDFSLGVGSTDPTPDSKGADDLCISPTYQKRGRFLVWPVSLPGGPPLPSNTSSAVVNAPTSA